MTDRWTARQPDETPVGDLPLRGHTLHALRAAGILTLGQLRAMGDRELLALRRLGPRFLADVRYLVPAPPRPAAVNPGREVTIAGRVFAFGTAYAPQRGSHGHKPRRLLRYSADSPLSGGRVEVAIVPSGQRRVMSGTEWVAWAGEPGSDVGSREVVGIRRP